MPCGFIFRTQTVVVPFPSGQRPGRGLRATLMPSFSILIVVDCAVAAGALRFEVFAACKVPATDFMVCALAGATNARTRSEAHRAGRVVLGAIVVSPLKWTNGARCPERPEAILRRREWTAAGVFQGHGNTAYHRHSPFLGEAVDPHRPRTGLRGRRPESSGVDSRGFIISRRHRKSPFPRRYPTLREALTEEALEALQSKRSRAFRWGTCCMRADGIHWGRIAAKRYRRPG